jgi:CRP-like cAMP-binding protein
MRHVLSMVELFKAAPPHAVDELARMYRTRYFVAGRALLRQGSVCPWLYVIVLGRVRVERAHPQFVQPVELAVLGPLSTIGELGMLDGSPQPVSAIALVGTHTLALPAAEVAALLAQYPCAWEAALPQVTWRSVLSFRARGEEPAGPALRPHLLGNAHHVPQPRLPDD